MRSWKYPIPAREFRRRTGHGYSTASLMDWADARQLLLDGFSLGSHSRTHPRLDEFDGAALADEITGSKREIEDRLGTSIDFFAYPYGAFNARVRDFVQRSGFTAACSTQSGFNNLTTDRFALRRLDIQGTDSVATFLRSLVFGENSMTTGRALQYYAKRVVSRLVPASG